jgi:redox-sensitive bicupin YhaK (pirin superfamily)
VSPGSKSPIRRIITPASKSLGEFNVRRALPADSQQRVGPFIFFDHMGPADFAPGTGVNVRPHPHIGIATITYLFSGQIRHRDSLGFDQVIHPGAVNWMTAGRGIVHSERTPEELKTSGSHLHGIQAWIALPIDQEEIDPGFVHYPASGIPTVERPGLRLHLIAGGAYGAESPVATASDTVYAEVDIDGDASLPLPEDVEELGLYIVDGEVDIGGERIAPGNLVVLEPGVSGPPRATCQSKCMLLGGGKLTGDRILWWNFVSSSRERLERAKRDWKEGRFAPVPDDPEFIPLPKS